MPFIPYQGEFEYAREQHTWLSDSPRNGKVMVDLSNCCVFSPYNISKLVRQNVV